MRAPRGLASQWVLVAQSGVTGFGAGAAALVAETAFGIVADDLSVYILGALALAYTALAAVVLHRVRGRMRPLERWAQSVNELHDMLNAREVRLNQREREIVFWEEARREVS